MSPFDVESLALEHQQFFHPASSLLPLMDDPQFAALKKSIQEDPSYVVVTYLGDKIIDGRSRYLACKALGVHPSETMLEDCDDPVSFVLRENLYRRHLSPSQRAAVAVDAQALRDKLAAEAANRKKRQPTDSVSLKVDAQKDRNAGRVDEQLAEQFDTNRTYIAKARKLAKESPSLLGKVKSGELSLAKATSQLRVHEPEEPEEQASDDEPRFRGVGVVRANEAIDCLMRIPKGDRLRDRAFEIVGDWIASIAPADVTSKKKPATINLLAEWYHRLPKRMQAEFRKLIRVADSCELCPACGERSRNDAG